MTGVSTPPEHKHGSTRTRQLLVHRDYVGWTGGHGKFLDYLAHVQAHPRWQVKVHLSARARGMRDNPFATAAPQALQWNPAAADALLLGGMDWTMYEGEPVRPVINLVQGVRHADPGSVLRSFLSRPAIRVCVSDAVADAILATGEVRGPVRVIPAAVDVAMLAALGRRPPGAKVFVDALKQPDFGREVAARLEAAGIALDLLIDRVPREDYLQRMADAAVVVTLPGLREGFYLPGLEALAMGRALVQYDCLGSRQYLRDGVNARVPVAGPVAVAGAAADLIGNSELRCRISAAAQATAADFGLAVERQRVHAVLNELDELWERT